MATISKRNGRWQARVRRAGFPTQTKTFSQKQDATRWVRQTEIKIETHELPQAAPEYPTFKRAVKRYRKEVSVFKKSYAVEKYRLAQLSCLPWANKPINQIDGSYLPSLRLQRLKAVSPATVRKELYLISAIYETARKEWGFNALRNPVSGIRMPSGANPKRTRIAPETLLKLRQAAASCQHKYLPHIITVALETGMRRGEIIGLRWVDLLPERGLVQLHDTKNGHGRFVPLSANAISALQQGDRRGEFIFPMTANAVRLAWERLKQKHEIEGVRFHDLRHEAISQMFDEGMTVPEVAAISGHRTVSMLFRYAHIGNVDSIARIRGVSRHADSRSAQLQARRNRRHTETRR